MNSLWLTWETQRRNRELASSFGAQLKQFDNSRLSSFKRYALSIKQTFSALKNKPEVVFCQCPSIVLCVLLAILKPFYKYKLIIDAHNAIVRYLYESGPLLSLLAKFVLRQTDFVILSNKGLFPLIPCSDHKKLSLPDKLPYIVTALDKPKAFSVSLPNVICICSYAVDEPIYEFLQAAKKLSSEARFFVTGRRAKASQLLLSFESENIVFTDFLTERDFEAYISFSDLTVDLTLFDNLLVCGAYETLAVGVPGVLSDTPIQRETFSKGYEFSDCDPESLEVAVMKALGNKDTLKEEIIKFRVEFEKKWLDDFENCRKRIFV